MAGRGVRNGIRKNSRKQNPTNDFCPASVIYARYAVAQDFYAAGKCRNKRAEWC